MNTKSFHISRGREGEQLAKAFLEKKGFEVKLCNWRSGRHEIDIMAVKDGVLHFVEVKTRHSTRFGFPEESVTKKKFNHMKDAAASFLTRCPGTRKIQFDILSILRIHGRPIEYLLLEDVYM